MKQQIDYQQIQALVPVSHTPTIVDIPLPINSILKGFSVQRKREDRGAAGMYQAVVYLSQEDKNSNVKIDHHLASGSIGHGGFYSLETEYFRWTLSKLLDHPIQKEGISLKVNVYNLTASSGNILVTTQIKNLEGGI